VLEMRAGSIPVMEMIMATKTLPKRLKKVNVVLITRSK
jgi:hypothetical protein